MIITLCGSTKFKKEFEEENKRLTLEGHIVLSVGVFGHSENITFTSSEKRLLDEIHKRKIDLSDEIFVINKDGYIGNSTNSEIKYACNHHKRVRYLDDRNKSYILISTVETMSDYKHNRSISHTYSYFQHYDEAIERIKYKIDFDINMIKAHILIPITEYKNIYNNLEAIAKLTSENIIYSYKIVDMSEEERGN